MASHSITITNRLKIYGPGSVSRWGTLQWGSGNWGSDRDTDFQVEKELSNTLTQTSSQAMQVEKALANQLGLSDELKRQMAITPASDVLVASDVSSLALFNASGWKYFELGSNDLDDRNISTYTKGTATDPGYTVVPTQSTVWS